MIYIYTLIYIYIYILLFLEVIFLLWKLRPLGHSLCVSFSTDCSSHLKVQFRIRLVIATTLCCCGSLPLRQTAFDEVTNEYSINQGTGALTLSRFEQVSQRFAGINCTVSVSN